MSFCLWLQTMLFNYFNLTNVSFCQLSIVQLFSLSSNGTPKECKLKEDDNKVLDFVSNNKKPIFFSLERGCPAAALRVWPWRTREKTPIELCGDTLDTYKQILSETNVLKLSFYLADKAVGAKGFKATWTEIKVNWAIKEIQRDQ